MSPQLVQLVDEHGNVVVWAHEVGIAQDWARLMFVATIALGCALLTVLVALTVSLMWRRR